MPGIYISDDLTRFKVFYDVLERDARGRLHRRQRTKTFARGERGQPYDYDDEGNPISALAAARRFKSERILEVLEKREQAKDVTLDDVFGMFMRSRDHRPSTADVYRYVYGRHIGPKLGRWALRNLDISAVEGWYDDLDAGRGAKIKAGRLLRALTSFAYRRGIIASDPGRVLRVSSFGVRSLRPDDVPTREAVLRLADEIGDRHRALVLLLALGGLRIGEAVALRVDRIDFERRRITVDQSATEVSGRLVFGPPKTHAGERSFTAPRVLIDALRDHVERFPTTTGLVFSAPEGGPLRPRNFRQRVFDPAVAGAGLDGLHLHDLRHACASTLAAHGASATEIAARLGHSNAAITQRVYMHLLRARDEQLAAMQDEAWAEDSAP